MLLLLVVIVDDDRTTTWVLHYDYTLVVRDSRSIKLACTFDTSTHTDIEIRSLSSLSLTPESTHNNSDTCTSSTNSLARRLDSHRLTQACRSSLRLARSLVKSTKPNDRSACVLVVVVEGG